MERLGALLGDPDASNADVIKASTLIFDQVSFLRTGEGSAAGDYEIIVKED